jgi:hypothetical protein
MGSINYGLENYTRIPTEQLNRIDLKHLAVLCHCCLFVFLALQPIVVVFSQPSSEL